MLNRLRSSWQRNLHAWLLALIAFGVYLPGFWFGAPHATGADRVQSWGVDDGTPLQPLADVHNVLQPKPDRNLGYPLMHSFVLVAAYSPYLGWLWLTGQFSLAGGATYPFGLADPVTALRALSLIAHFVAVLMGVGTVVAAWDAARALWGHRTAALAGLLAMTLFPMFYYSRTGNPDVPMLFYSSVAVAAFARSLAHGFTVRRAVWLGMFTGFAAATKEQIAALFVAAPLVLMWLLWREGKAADGWFSWKLWKAPLAGAAAAFLAFGFGSGLFVDPNFFFAHVQFASGRMQDLASGNVAFSDSYPRTWEGHLALARLLFDYLADCLTLPGVALSLIGIVWVARREPRFALLALLPTGYLAILFFSARAGQLRYVLPAALVMALFEARAVALAWESRRRILRLAGAGAALLVLALASLRGLDLTHAMLRDSRYAAAQWLATHAHPGAKVEFFGPSSNLPALAAGVESTRAAPFLGAVYRYDTGPDAVSAVLAGWRSRQPDLIIVLPDHSSTPGAPYNVTCPPEVYRGLLEGAYGYRLAAAFETPPLLPWVRRPELDYPSVNPPVRIFSRVDPARRSAGGDE